MPVTPNRSIVHRTRGVTLVELLVAVMILVIMILAFSAILSQGEKVVTTSQRVIRANAQAGAIAQVFRRDITSITTDGFLHISGTNKPALLCTSLGPFVARNPPGGAADVRANAAVICYSESAAGGILCREAYLLTTAVGGMAAGSMGGDVLCITLSDIEHDRPGSDPNTVVGKFSSSAPSVVAMPATLTEAENTWPILVTGCSNISVQYRTLNTSGALNAWSSGSGTWTHDNRTNWPVLIKLKYTLSDQDYEVVCPIGG